jgi:hypothetical protein
MMKLYKIFFGLLLIFAFVFQSGTIFAQTDEMTEKAYNAGLEAGKTVLAEKGDYRKNLADRYREVLLMSNDQKVTEKLKSAFKEGYIQALDLQVGRIPVKEKVSGKAYVWVEIENENSTNVQKPGTSWNSTKETNPTWRNINPREGYSGTGGWYLSREGDSLTYKINVSERGDYVLWLRSWTDKKHPFGSQAVKVIIDGITLGNFSEHSSEAGYGWGKLTVVNLSVGTHTLTIQKKETTSAAAILDAMLLTTDTSYIPSGKVPATMIEREKSAATPATTPGGPLGDLVPETSQPVAIDLTGAWNGDDL